MITLLRRNILKGFLFLVCLVAASGCGVVVVAGLGALGGYVISPDTVEGVTGYTANELYASADDILSVMGSVYERSKSEGRIVAIVNGARVTMNFVPTSKSSTTLRVKARKGILPKIAVAQDVYMKIVRKLQE